MEAFFLTGGCPQQAAGNAADEDDSAEPHIEERHGERAEHEAGKQGAEAAAG